MPTAKKSPVPAAQRSAVRPKREAAEAADPFDFQTDSLGYALRRAQVRAFDLFFEMLGTLDLSPARLTALSIVAMEPEINQAALARRLGIAGPSVLKLVDALEGAGFIARREVEGDRRRYSLVLTTAGRGMLERVRSELAAYETRLARKLKGDEREQLMALLAKVAT